MVRRQKLVDPDNGKTPSMRINHEWKAHSKKGLFGGYTKFTFNCRGESHTIKLKDVLIDKNEHFIVTDKARLMREAGDRFFFMVDTKTYGVNKFTRKGDGYYLFTFKRNKFNSSRWDIERFYYSAEEVLKANVTPELEFHNVFWRVIRYCYYGVAIKENDGGDNSS